MHSSHAPVEQVRRRYVMAAGFHMFALNSGSDNAQATKVSSDATLRRWRDQRSRWTGFHSSSLLTQSVARPLAGLEAGLSDWASSSVLGVSPANSLVWLAVSLLDAFVAVYRYRRRRRDG